MGVHVGRNAPDLLLRHVVGALEQLFPGQAALLAEADGDHVAQKRQAFRVQRLAGHGGFQLGTELRHNLRIVGIAEALHQHHGVGVGLLEQILRFVDLVGGVDSHQNGADLGRGPEGDVPLRNVRGPDRHLGAGLDAHGQQRAGAFVHVVTELLIGARVIEGGIFECVLVGEFLHHLVEHLRKGLFNQRVLFPDVAARFGAVEIKVVLLARGRFKGGKVVFEVRKNDVHFGQVGHPLRLPVQRQKAVVVDGGQRAHHVAQRQVALADQAEPAALAVVLAVGQLYVPDIGAEVFDRVFGALVCKEHRLVHRPQRAQRVAGERFQRLAQQRRVAKQAPGLQQDGDALFFGGVHRLRQTAQHVFPGVFPVARGVNADIRHTQGRRKRKLFFDCGGVGVGVFVRQIQIQRKIHRADVLFRQLAHGGADGVFVKRSLPVEQGGIHAVIKLNAGKAELFGKGQIVRPAVRLPAADGKGKIHAQPSS